jgi:hypothetical protein
LIGIFDLETAVVKGQQHQDIRYNLDIYGFMVDGLAASRLGCGEGEAIVMSELKKPSEILNLSRQ